MFKISDVVRLNSGGPRMFVADVRKTSRGKTVVDCEFGYPQNGSATFPVECLTKLGHIPKQFFIENGAGKLGPC